MVSIIACTIRDTMMNNIFNNYSRQLWKEKELIIILNKNSMNKRKWIQKAANYENVSVYQLPQHKTLGDCLNFGIRKARYSIVAKLDDDDYYSKYYLNEAMKKFKNSNAQLIGKKRSFMYFKKRKVLTIRRMRNSLKGGTLMFKKELYPRIKFPSRKGSGTDSAFVRICRRKNVKIRSTGRYNYVYIRYANKNRHTYKKPNFALWRSSKKIGKVHNFIRYTTKPVGFAEWQNRPLKNTYSFVFMDTLDFKIKQKGRMIKKTAYICIGIDLEGKTDILGIWIGDESSVTYWNKILNQLKNRRVYDIRMACVDNLNGFQQALATCYPNANIQKCLIHQIRNSTHGVSNKHIVQVLSDLKQIIDSETDRIALEKLHAFEAKWSAQYPLISQSWRQNWEEIKMFFHYPPEIRQLISSTNNNIEHYHQRLINETRKRKFFESDKSLLRLLCFAAMDIAHNWKMPVPQWEQVLLQSKIYLPGRI